MLAFLREPQKKKKKKKNPLRINFDLKIEENKVLVEIGYNKAVC